MSELKRCIVCDEPIVSDKSVCDRSSCNEFYEHILVPLQDVFQIIEVENNEESNIDWDEFFAKFLQLPQPAQAWLLTEEDLPDDIYWECIQLLESAFLLNLLNQKSFRDNFLDRLSPQLADAARKEMQLWTEELKNKNLSIDVVITQIQAFIAILIEAIFVEKEREEEEEINEYTNENILEEKKDNSIDRDQI